MIEQARKDGSIVWEIIGRRSSVDQSLVGTVEKKADEWWNIII